MSSGEVLFRQWRCLAVMYGTMFVENQTPLSAQTPLQTVKHSGGGEVMILTCFAAAGCGHH